MGVGQLQRNIQRNRGRRRTIMKEYRVYVINPYEPIHPQWQGVSFLNLSDEEFMDISEEQGRVYTLKGFERAFNHEDISHHWYIKIINK